MIKEFLPIEQYSIFFHLKRIKIGKSFRILKLHFRNNLEETLKEKLKSLKQVKLVHTQLTSSFGSCFELVNNVHSCSATIPLLCGYHLYLFLLLMK